MFVDISNFGNFLDELAGVNSRTMSSVSGWTKDDKGYRVTIDHAGIGEVDVAIDEDCVCVTGSADVFGDKRTITKTFYLPCKQSEIEQIAYQTINGVTMIRIFTQQPKERKIPINKI